MILALVGLSKTLTPTFQATHRNPSIDMLYFQRNMSFLNSINYTSLHPFLAYFKRWGERFGWDEHSVKLFLESWVMNIRGYDELIPFSSLSDEANNLLLML